MAQNSQGDSKTHPVLKSNAIDCASIMQLDGHVDAILHMTVSLVLHSRFSFWHGRHVHWRHLTNDTTRGIDSPAVGSLP